MKEVADRINQILVEKNINKSKLADIAGVSNQAVTNWGKRNQISIEAARRICNTLNLSIEWLLNGTAISKSNAKDLMKIDEWDSNTPLDDDEFEVPFFKDIRLAAGNGFADDIEDYNNYKLRLSKSTMRRYNIDKEAVVCLTVSGDSMTPVFRDGTTVGIDRSDLQIKDGKIYAINHDGLLRVKMLENMPGNQIKIKSYNANYEDEIVNAEDVTVLGRVWWQSSILD